MNILEKVKSLFSSNSPDKNYIKFTLEDNGEVAIEGKWDYSNPQNYSAFLFELNNGVYLETILATLEQMANNDGQQAAYQDMVGQFYNMLEQYYFFLEKEEEQPVVKPTEVFGSSQDKGETPPQ